MSSLEISASPHPDIRLTRFDPELFSGLQQLLDKLREKLSESSSPFSPRMFSDILAETAFRLVLENLSEKPITALRYRWSFEDAAGEMRHSTVSSDSYHMNVVISPVVPAGDRYLISTTGGILESTLLHFASGGGVMGGGGDSSNSALTNAKEVRFSLDFVMFEDGEIAGEDRDRYAAQLRARKPAAEFIAKQVHLAEAENRDVRPVLEALQSIPQWQGDIFQHWIAEFARYYLRRSGVEGFDTANHRLHFLETRPALPKFYRRKS